MPALFCFMQLLGEVYAHEKSELLLPTYLTWQTDPQTNVSMETESELARRKTEWFFKLDRKPDLNNNRYNNNNNRHLIYLCLFPARISYTSSSGSQVLPTHPRPRHFLPIFLFPSTPLRFQKEKKRIKCHGNHSNSHDLHRLAKQ